MLRVSLSWASSVSALCPVSPSVAPRLMGPNISTTSSRMVTSSSSRLRSSFTYHYKNKFIKDSHLWNCIDIQSHLDRVLIPGQKMLQRAVFVVKQVSSQLRLSRRQNSRQFKQMVTITNFVLWGEKEMNRDDSEDSQATNQLLSCLDWRIENFSRRRKYL